MVEQGDERQSVKHEEAIRPSIANRGGGRCRYLRRREVHLGRARDMHEEVANDS